MSLKPFLVPLQKALPAALLVVAVIAGLLIWQGWAAYSNFQRDQKVSADRTVQNAADQIALYLQGLNRNLSLFSKLESDRINALAKAPERQDLQTAVRKRIRNHFPTAFAFTLTDLYGKPLLSSPNNMAETQEHLRMPQLSAAQALPANVHRDNEGYHFHILANWLNSDQAIDGHIIVSFRCGVLCKLLFRDAGSTASPVLLRPRQADPKLSGSPLIASGSDPGETETLAQTRIPGIHWDVVQLADPTLASKKLAQLLKENLIIFSILVLSSLSILSLAMRRIWRQNQNTGCLHELKENEQKLAAIVEAAGEGIVLVDTGGAFQLFNPAAEAMFGYTREEVLGRGMDMLFQGTGNIEPNQYFSRIVNNGNALGSDTSHEVLGKRKNGEKFPIRISLNQYELDGEIHFVGLIQDISEQLKAKERLDFLSTHDALTGLMNRREFERLLESLLAISDSEDQQHVLCYIDVDQFKVVNDTLGHMAGDDLLRQIGILIKAQLRDSGTIARLGGDEFGILLGDCNIERAQERAYGLLQTIGNFLFTWKDKSVEVGVSIGLAEFNPNSDIGDNVLSAADVACHMAKEQGRNRIHIYHPGDVDLIRHHGDMHLVSGITQALNEERFHLYAQPIVPVKPTSTESRHYEVLVRMVDETGNLVIPEHFIPAAERYILMPAIDRWIISQLFSTQGENLRLWSTLNHGRGFLFAINLSGTSLSDEGFLSYVKRQFSKWDIPYNAVCFEITETAAIANLSRARELIYSLKELGCYFALDDFGAGLSSFSYLKDLPVDYLKIDGSFVRHMTEDPVDYAMVESINQIGHILGLRTIAEWAEDSATLNQLRALNVDFAQGYGVGEPEPLESFSIR